MKGLGSKSLAVGFVVVAWLVFALPWFWEGKIIPWDAKAHFYPMIRFVADSFAAGESFFWSPYHYGGYPMIADPQSMIFTPSFWPLILAGPAPSLRAVDAVHLAHLLATGFAVMCFGRLRGWGWSAALAAAVGAMLAGPVTIRLEHLLMTISYTWLAVALWRIEALIQRGGLWRGVVLGLVAGLLLTDRNHVAYLSAWVLAGYALVRIWPLRARVLGPLAVAALLSVAVAALPLMLLLQFVEQGSRQGFDLSDASFQSMHPAALASLLTPEFFGPLDRWGDFWGPTSTEWGEMLAMHWGMMHAYCGVLAIAMLIWGLVSGLLWHREACVWLVISIGLIVYALGRYTPVFAELYAVVPGVDLFRRPADALIPFGLAVALLTGALLDRTIKCPLAEAPYKFPLAAGLLALLLIPALRIAFLREQLEPAAHSLLWLLVGLAAFAIAIAAAKRLEGAARAAVLLTIPAIHAGDLIFAHQGLILNAQPPSLHRQLVEPRSAEHWAVLDDLLTQPDPSGAPWRIETLGLGTAVQNIGQVASFHNILGYNPIRLRTFDQLIAPRQQNNSGFTRNWGSGMTGYESRLADRLGIRYVLLGAPVENVQPGLAPLALRLIGVFDRDRGRKAYLYENPDVLPRAILEPGGDVAITRYSHAEIRLSTSCDVPCRLTLHEFAYPGWEATVDGASHQIESEAGLFRSLDLPAGKHEVVFQFRPLSSAALLGLAESLMAGR